MKHSPCSPGVRISLDRLPWYNSTVSLKLAGTAKPRDCLPVCRPQAACPSSAHRPPAWHPTNPVSDTAKGRAAHLKQIKGPDSTWALLFPPSCIFGKSRFGFQAEEGLNRLRSTRLEYKPQIAVPGSKSVTKQLCHAGEHPRAWLPLPWVSVLPPGAQGWTSSTISFGSQCFVLAVRTTWEPVLEPLWS